MLYCAVVYFVLFVRPSYFYVVFSRFCVYCKTLNVYVPFISRAKQKPQIKEREYQLQAKIGRNYYSVSNCMVLIRQNKRGQNNFAC